MPKAKFFHTKKLMNSLGFPSNHESHSSLPREGYENEIAVLDTATGRCRTVYRPKDNFFVGHVDLHWDGTKMVFTQSNRNNWEIREIGIDGQGLRKVSKTPDDVDCYEPCYLPDGRIVVASNAPFQCVPCWHGVNRKFVANLYIMDGDGSNMRRLCFDQDHDSNPSVRNNGRVVYSRWDYTGINRLFLRPLMSMNPDGTAQRALYGSNSWFPNALYAPRELPGKNGQFIAILSGYHGSYKAGHLVILDTSRGTKEEKGIIKRISGKGLPLQVKYMDQLTATEYPKFLMPFPVTDRHFLVTIRMNPKSREMGIYLADMDDKVDLLYEEKGTALLEAIPVMKRTLPPVIPQRVNTARKDASVYLQNIYVGPGLKGVPKGTIKKIRVIAYHFGYIGLAGNDKIGLSGPWDAMRIIGTTPVEKDGSAVFRVPANTPIAFQALDTENKAVQLMRTWFSAMPGESISCVGCHESASDVPPPKQTIASSLAPRELEPWYGPARGFDFEREVQPVLNKYCVSCHDGKKKDRPDLRSEKLVKGYEGLVPGRLDSTRMSLEHREMYGGKVRYTPAYEVLINYIRRVNVGDDVSILDPGHYHADTSELVRMIQQRHKGVNVDKEGLERITTWIDLNGPCHGTWRDVFDRPVLYGQHERRMELFKLYGGPADDPESIPKTPAYDETPVKPGKEPKRTYAFALVEIHIDSDNLKYRDLDLGNGLKIKLVKYNRNNWVSTCEISNEQFRCFDPKYDSGYYIKRHLDRGDTKGMKLNGPKQPVLRVSHNEAIAFCKWLSKKTKSKVSLPSEEEWEFMCMEGKRRSRDYGNTTDDDFSKHANMADRTFATFGYKRTRYFAIGGDVDYIAAEGVKLADTRYDDKACVTSNIGSYQPNALGLHDMHGNAAEWTSTEVNGEYVVKGGSYLDRPAKCRALYRCLYPPWQKVHNAGFRIVVRE